MINDDMPTMKSTPNFVEIDEDETSLNHDEKMNERRLGKCPGKHCEHDIVFSPGDLQEQENQCANCISLLKNPCPYKSTK